MKTLCVDPGDVRIGIAISDENGNLAFPLTIIQHVSYKENARKIIDIANNQLCGTIIVGVPYDLDGNIGARARKSFRLIETLQKLTDLVIIPWDETGSSLKVAAMQDNVHLKRKKRKMPIDDQAAAVILADYLENTPHHFGNINP